MLKLSPVFPYSSFILKHFYSAFSILMGELKAAYHKMSMKYHKATSSQNKNNNRRTEKPK